MWGGWRVFMRGEKERTRDGSGGCVGKMMGFVGTTGLSLFGVGKAGKGCDRRRRMVMSEEGGEAPKVKSGGVRIGGFGAEDRNPPGVTLRIDAGFAFYAHPEKRTGEDAFFVEGTAVGVFDGVTGVDKLMRGVDPRLYAQNLARMTADKVRQYGPQGVVKALIEADEEIKTPGASTACVIGMDENARLFGIHVGDSGVIIVRDGRVGLRTTEQMKEFNAPFQLGSQSPYTVLMGQNITWRAAIGDWIIVASDGLFDNVFDQTIVSVVESNKSSGPTAVAEALGTLAWENGQDKTVLTPYGAAAQKAGRSHSGGKIDDVTVVACEVVNNPSWTPMSVFSEFD